MRLLSLYLHKKILKHSTLNNKKVVPSTYSPLLFRWVKECDGTHSEFECRGQRMERKHRTIKKGRAEVQQKQHIRKKEVKNKCHLCEFGTNGICFRELH